VRWRDYETGEEIGYINVDNITNYKSIYDQSTVPAAVSILTTEPSYEAAESYLITLFPICSIYTGQLPTIASEILKAPVSTPVPSVLNASGVSNPHKNANSIAFLNDHSPTMLARPPSPACRNALVSTCYTLIHRNDDNNNIISAHADLVSKPQLKLYKIEEII